LKIYLSLKSGGDMLFVFVFFEVDLI